MSEADITRVYRFWPTGNIMDKEERGLVGGDLNKFRRLAANDEVVERTPAPNADEDELFFG